MCDSTIRHFPIAISHSLQTGKHWGTYKIKYTLILPQCQILGAISRWYVSKTFAYYFYPCYNMKIGTFAQHLNYRTANN